MKDASVFWASCDNSINLHDYEDNTICVNGVDADAMFMACRNALCSKTSLFEELKTKKRTVESAKEMIEALQKYVDKNDTTTEDN
tara:strand:- start:450 stop:704 length:255 start_codon:yes stop_codon:yes gene_type:complete